MEFSIISDKIVNDIILTQLVKGEVKKQYGGMWKVYGGYVEGMWRVYFCYF